MRKIIVLLLATCLAGCAHVVSKELREEAANGVDTEALFRIPETFKGQTVILGGTVVNSTNTEEGTYIEVVEKPLDNRGRPKNTDVTRGRFIILDEEFLDTAIYARGRLVTVAGDVQGVKEGRLGEVIYRYPLIRARELHLIKPRRAPRVSIGLGVFHGF